MSDTFERLTAFGAQTFSTVIVTSVVQRKNVDIDCAMR
jgi:hypothetical protein